MEQSYIAYIREMVKDQMIILNGTAVVIPNEAGEILLQRRSDNGLWGLPGGMMELTDTIASCAIREVFEETNLSIELTHFLGVFVNPLMQWKNNDKAKVIGFGFVGKVLSGDLAINDEESLELKYFSKETLPKIHAVDHQAMIDAYYNQTFNIIEGKRYQ